jgi:DNA-binding transcriptional regulator YiaG
VPDIAPILKEEIRRRAKLEVKAHTSSIKAAVAECRREIATLKRLVQTQQREIAFLKAKCLGQSQRKQEDEIQGVRYSARSVKAQRKRLKLSAADFGKLVGVSGVTVYHWEKGTVRPKNKRLAAFVAVRQMGRREALAKLGLSRAPGLPRGAELNVERARAIAEIEKIGGKIVADKKSPGKPVISVDLRFTKVSDAALEHLKRLPALQSLDLGATPVTDAGLGHLKALAQLHSLVLTWTQVTDAGLEHLKGLTQLHSLILTWTKVTDAGLRHLKRMLALQSLDLTQTQVTDAGLVHLEDLTQLQTLILEGTKVTDAGMAHLKGLTRLKSLDLRETKVTDAGMAHLKGWTRLKSLDLRETKVTDAAIKRLRKVLPGCRIHRSAEKAHP